MNPIIRTLGSPFAAAFRTIPRLIRQPSLWPDRPRKSLTHRYLENLWIRLVDHGVCLEYNAFGLDLKGSPHWRTFVTNAWRAHHMAQWRTWSGIDYTAVLQDKALFADFFGGHGIPVVPNVALYNPLFGGGYTLIP